MSIKKFFILLTLMLLGSTIRPGAAQVPATQTFTPIELELHARINVSNYYVNGVGVSATFTAPTGHHFTIAGFWDGGDTYRVRFAPTMPGSWSYITKSKDANLNNVQGSFEARSSTPEEIGQAPLLHGFLNRKGAAWMLSDGTPFVPVGDTQFSWTEEYTKEENLAWLDVLQQKNLNSLLGCVWLGTYKPPIEDRSLMQPFDGTPAQGNLNPAFFQNLDALVKSANDRGIVAGLMIGGFPGNSNWWRMFSTRSNDDRWFRYVVSRYAAYNVRWVLYGECDEANPPWDNKKDGWKREAEYKASLVKKADPFDHPVAVHLTSDKIANESVYDYLCLQTEAPGHRSEEQYKFALEARTKASGRPLLFEEYWYENSSGDGEYKRGLRNTYRNFIAALAFPTFGSLWRAHAMNGDFVPRQIHDTGIGVAEYLLNNDIGLKRMSRFANFARSLDTLSFHTFAQNNLTRGVAGKFGNAYAVFLQSGGQTTVQLPHGLRSYKITMLAIDSDEDITSGTLKSGRDGRLKIDTHTNRDVALVLEPE